MPSPESQYVFGIRPVIEAIRSGREIDKVLIKRGLRGELFHELSGLIKTENIPVQYVPVEKINRFTRKNHQGIIALMSVIEYARLDHILPSLYEEGKIPFLIMVDGVTDVRNLGAIIRSAESAGIHALILPVKRSALPTTDTIKTSAGALFHLPICRTDNLKNTLIYLKESGLQLVVATEKAEKSYHDIDYTSPTIIIVGAEDKGVSKQVYDIVNELVKIPMAGKTNSLNVSVAAALLMYEAVRQRMISAGP